MVFLLTYGIGLLPPILIRYIFVRETLKRSRALIIVIVFYIIHLFIVILLSEGRPSAHFPLIIIATISYGILYDSFRYDIMRWFNKWF